MAALTATAATPAAAAGPRGEAKNVDHVISTPLMERQAALKQAALEAVLRGEAVTTGNNKVVNLHRERGNKFVELAFEGEDKILTLLGEFGDMQATHNHGSFGVINHGGDPGPSHNEIPQPDRTQDNSTIWVPDFSREHYDNLLHNKDLYPSMANYYLEQSSGQYSVTGHVGPWVEVPYNAAAYGSNYCGSIVCTRDIGRFIEDQADGWWPVLVAEQGSEAAANAFLAQFDVWDRYDFDGDGNFDEADGYIDHFQSVHAGEGEETGGGAQGEDAIWSHRSFVNSVPFGAGGPPGGPAYGGAQIGNSNYWIGDYTIEPENGGVGVFAHEFAHDLGLPDLYDTSGNTGGAENSTGWWSIMSQGSYGDQSSLSIGEYPTHFSAQEKLYLGFLENYTVTTYNASGNFVLGPAEYNTARPQAMVVVLPDKQVTQTVWEPYAGDWMYYSRAGDDLENTMTKAFTLGAGPISLSMKAKYHIETCWDYAYIEVSTDGGTTFTPIANSAESDENDNGQNQGHGITGVSGQVGPPSTHCDDLSAEPQWIDVTADLSAYANSTIHLRFRYWTDGAVTGTGFSFDNLQITGQAMDGAETDTGWTFDGFVRTNGEVTDEYFNAYVIELRRHIGYDDSLRRGPYNFGFPDRPNFVEHFRYEPGVLVWYWDLSQHDNNVGEHPGEGYLLPVDSHPAINTWDDTGTQMRPRINSYDSPFTIKNVRQVQLHNPATGVLSTIPERPGVRRFNDSNSYWVSGHPSDAPADGRYQAEWNSVIVPNTGFDFRIKRMTPQKVVLRINL